MPNTKDIVVTQQTLNIIKQLLNAKGWPETLSEAYIGGKLATKYLPELDDLSWVKTGAELEKLTPAELTEYRKRDEEWGAKSITLSLAPNQVNAITKAFKFFVAELLKNKQLGAAPFIMEIVDAFDIDLDEKALSGGE